jgi:hypothetical protein
VKNTCKGGKAERRKPATGYAAHIPAVMLVKVAAVVGNILVLQVNHFNVSLSYYYFFFNK